MLDAKTQKAELTRAAVVGAALELALTQGLEAISLQAVADQIGLSKSGVFSRVGSREALQKAVIEEYGRRFVDEVFVPAMRMPKGLPRLNEIVRRWIARTRDVEANRGCLYAAGAFELDDCEGELRDCLLREVKRWRAALRRSVQQAMDAGHLRPDTEPEQVVSEVSSMIIGLLHDARFLRDAHAGSRCDAAWQRLIRNHQVSPS